MRILVVEDDELLNKILCYNLISDGYKVDYAFTQFDAENLLNKNIYNLVVLDVNLPDGDGFNICKYIKSEFESTAVIFLTAKDMESDMLKGFELGADDYITKPFPTSVFQKKVSVLLYRLNKNKIDDLFYDGNLKINFTKMETSSNGIKLNITAIEYRLLNILIKNKDKVMTRQMLLEKLWDREEKYVNEHTLTSTISRLRNKIEKNGKEYIKTVYGAGYIWIGKDNEE